MNKFEKITGVMVIVSLAGGVMLGFDHHIVNPMLMVSGVMAAIVFFGLIIKAKVRTVGGKTPAGAMSL